MGNGTWCKSIQMQAADLLLPRCALAEIRHMFVDGFW
jgi:hypothetical protein